LRLRRVQNDLKPLEFIPGKPQVSQKTNQNLLQVDFWPQIVARSLIGGRSHKVLGRLLWKMWQGICGATFGSTGGGGEIFGLSRRESTLFGGFLPKSREKEARGFGVPKNWDIRWGPPQKKRIFPKRFPRGWGPQ